MNKNATVLMRGTSNPSKHQLFFVITTAAAIATIEATLDHESVEKVDMLFSFVLGYWLLNTLSKIC